MRNCNIYEHNCNKEHEGTLDMENDAVIVNKILMQRKISDHSHQSIVVNSNLCYKITDNDSGLVAQSPLVLPYSNE